MKNSILLIAFLFCTMFSFAQVSVKGYYRSNGTYVQAHQRTVPNATRNDNYSTVGNTNPYTGKAGTVPRDGYYTTPTSTKIPTYTSSTTSTYYPSSTTYRGDTKMPYYPPNPTTTYSIPSTTSSKTIYTGPRGGQYCINSNELKVENTLNTSENIEIIKVLAKLDVNDLLFLHEIRARSKSNLSPQRNEKTDLYLNLKLIEFTQNNKIILTKFGNRVIDIT